MIVFQFNTEVIIKFSLWTSIAIAAIVISYNKLNGKALAWCMYVVHIIAR